VRESAPTPQEAQAGLAEASNQTARVRRADHQLRWVVIAFAAAYLAQESTFNWWRSNTGLLGLVVVGGSGCVVLIWLALRIRAYSRFAIGVASTTLVVFFVWNLAVRGVAFATGLAGPQQPVQATVTDAIGVIPLIVGAWLIGRR
jgi:hypothetical protein